MRRLLITTSIAWALAACGTGPGAPDAGAVPGRDSGPPPPPRDAGPDLCPHEGPLDASVPLTSRDRCVEGIVPMGFGLRWQSTAQRLATLGLALDFGDDAPSGCPPGSTSRGATLIVQASGGEVSDAPDQPVAIYDYQVVGGRDDSGPVPDGSIPLPRFARGSATIELRDGADEGEGLALIDVSRLDPAASIVVVIDGFELTTDVAQSAEYPPAWDPARGYASRGLGIAVLASEVADGTATVRVRARFEPGIRRRDEWEPGHDLAVAVASTRATVRLLAIAADVAPATGSVGYRYAARRNRVLEQGAACRPGDEETMLSIDGQPGLARAVVGFTRFDLALWPDDLVVGDRLREISIRVLEPAYDPATGRATMRVEGYASNEGLFPRAGMDARVEAEVALAQWSGEGVVEPVSVEAVSIAAPATVGLTRVGLPMQ